MSPLIISATITRRALTHSLTRSSSPSTTITEFTRCIMQNRLAILSSLVRSLAFLQLFRVTSRPFSEIPFLLLLWEPLRGENSRRGRRHFCRLRIVTGKKRSGELNSLPTTSTLENSSRPAFPTLITVRLALTILVGRLVTSFAPARSRLRRDCMRAAPALNLCAPPVDKTSLRELHQKCTTLHVASRYGASCSARLYITRKWI